MHVCLELDRGLVEVVQAPHVTDCKLELHALAEVGTANGFQWCCLTEGTGSVSSDCKYVKSIGID